jgi:serine/threonine protein kinase
MLYDNESELLKIIDFGTAIKINPDQPFTSLIGTPFYIAPEVI